LITIPDILEQVDVAKHVAAHGNNVCIFAFGDGSNLIVDSPAILLDRIVVSSISASKSQSLLG
jgi:hypothetical protein